MTEPLDDPNTNITEGGVPASLGPRFLALLLDFVILWVPIVLVWSVATRFLPLYLAPYVNTAIAFAYFVYLESTRGQTFGKQILRLRIRNQEGSYPTLEQASKRNVWLVLGILPGFIGGLVALGAVIWIAVSISLDKAHRQGVHDIFARATFVTRYEKR